MPWLSRRRTPTGRVSCGEEVDRLLTRVEAVDLFTELHGQWSAEQARLNVIDRYARWQPDLPYAPNRASDEYRKLRDLAVTPWLGLVVTAVAQNLYVEGFRSGRSADDSPAWRFWQRNGLDHRQIAIHRAALTYGYAFTAVLPSDGGVPSIRGVSPRRMLAFYEAPEADDWPVYAMRRLGQRWELIDDTAVYQVTTGVEGFQVVGVKEHNLGMCPVVRFANMLDLEGRSPGEVEPHIPTAARINQTTFDRLLVQRFASWVVRTVSGMSMPATTEATGETPEQAKLRLSAETLLIAADKDARFGSLPATPLSGFIEAHDEDVKALAAVTQTPAHELLGQMANLSAEALAAARASLMGKVEERRHSFGESWEQTLRLASHAAGDRAGAEDFESEVRWRDTEIRSLNQAADALGKIAQMLGVPAQVLWEKIPGWTQQDVDRAKALVEQGGGLEALMRELADGQAAGV